MILPVLRSRTALATVMRWSAARVLVGVVMLMRSARLLMVLVMVVPFLPCPAVDGWFIGAT